MSAAISRLTPVQERQSENRRRTSRLAARAVAQLNSMDGEHVRVAIGDLSAHGCSVRCLSDWLRAGRFVSVGIEDQPPLPALIRWVRDDIAGLEFLRPIPADRSEWHSLIA